ncbi:MAG: site-specific DNA-methyltransferase [Nanoarchaeota archaeon]|nr:site-specific DNA-methyltransferase [Nanoarchaeota archaeon]MBU1644552.1 site-specific DNA-methyltransferase [Nanoarchaeota archaeon]MBU1976845.1 site-specific DNA-methyltransferase [Nanoarchaeota archaeon]
MSNRLNNFSVSEWLKFTQSWFVNNSRNKGVPEELIKEFVSFFTKAGDVVLDPFLKEGNTLAACYHSKRNGIGIEPEEGCVENAKNLVKKLEGQLQLTLTGAGQHCKQFVLQGDPSNIDYLWQQYSLPEVDFLITSPPVAKGLSETFVKIKSKLRDGAYLVLILNNWNSLSAWGLVQEMSGQFQFVSEKVWCQEKPLSPQGYGYRFMPNMHHHYCFIFKKIK